MVIFGCNALVNVHMTSKTNDADFAYLLRGFIVSWLYSILGVTANYID